MARLPEDVLLERWIADPRATVRDVQDWDALSARARRHGLGAVVHRSALAAGLTLPPSVIAIREEAQRIEDAWHRRLVGLVGESFDVFARAGIRGAILKGPVLGERLYEVASDRISTDIDLLVARADLDGAVDALSKIGFEIDAGPTQQWHREHHHHVALHRRDELTIELHFRAFTGFGAVIPAEPLLERSVEYTMHSGIETRVLAPEDEWFYLAAHAAGHLFERLSWIYDLRRFADRYPELSSSVVTERVHRFDLDRAIAFTAHTLASLQIPSPVATPARAGRERLAALAREAALDASTGPMRQIGTMVFTGLLADDAGRAGQLVMRDTIRIVRRRAQRYFPSWVPTSWGA